MYSLLATVLGVLSFAMVTQIGCPSPQFYGTQTNPSEEISFNNLTCNSHCGCKSTQYEPVCSADGQTVFFSPCHAGCKKVEELVIDQTTKKSIKRYLDCECVATSSKETQNQIANPWPKEWPDLTHFASATFPSRPFRNQHTLDYAFAGYCPSDCSSQFNILLGGMLAVGVIGAASKLPNALLFLRAIEQRDKSVAVTVTITCISSFALLPSPIMFGSIYDASCVVWSEKCGEKFNCLAYNVDHLRVACGTLASVFVAFGLCCDIAVWYYVKTLSLFDDDKASAKEEDSTTIADTNNVAERNDVYHKTTLEMEQVDFKHCTI